MKWIVEAESIDDIVLGRFAVNLDPLTECKDCKHHDPEDKKCDCGHNIIWQLPRDDKWYCADAERWKE